MTNQYKQKQLNQVCIKYIRQYYIINQYFHNQPNSQNFINDMYGQYCEFCNILKRHQNPNSTQPGTKIIFEDKQFFAFHDLNKATATEHILICTKEHIQTALDVQNSSVLYRMREIGTKVLDQITNGKGIVQDYRFGFHLKPYNSIDHIHLHCFVLPFKSFLQSRIVYGHLMSSIEDVASRLQNKLHPRL